MFASKFTKNTPVSMIESGKVLEQPIPELLTEGIQKLVIVDVQDLGVVHTTYGDKARLAVILESPEASVKFPGKNKSIRVTMTASLHSDSNFSKFIRVLGFDVTDGKFAVKQLYNVSFDGNIVNTATDKGIIYSNLSGIIPGTIKGVPAQLVQQI